MKFHLIWIFNRIRSPSSTSSVVVENLRVLRRDSAIQRFKKLLDQSPGKDSLLYNN